MTFLKMLGCIAAAALVANAAQAKCAAHVGRSDADAMSLVAAPTALAVAMDGDRRTVTTLGTITNPSGVCFTDLVVEIQYFDASGSTSTRSSSPSPMSCRQRASRWSFACKAQRPRTPRPT